MDELIPIDDAPMVQKPLGRVAKKVLPTIEKKTDKWIKQQEAAGKLVSIAALATELGCSADSLEVWRDLGLQDDRYAPATRIYKKARQASLVQLQQKVYTSNASGSMFLLKSMHGYRDHDSAAAAKAGGAIVININTGVSKPTHEPAARTIDVQVEEVDE